MIIVHAEHGVFKYGDADEFRSLGDGRLSVQKGSTRVALFDSWWSAEVLEEGK